MAKHGEPIEFEYSQITDEIFIGTNQCCQTHFNQELIRKGFHADVSLEEKSIDAPFGAEYYLWLPVPDRRAPSFEQFDVGTRFLDGLVKNREKVYVHCKRGHGRAPTLVAAYLIAYQHLSPEKAWALIKERRPGVHPNKTQMEAVKNFINKFKARSLL